MSDTLSRTLTYMAKAGAILVLVAETGRKVMSLCED